MDPITSLKALHIAAVTVLLLSALLLASGVAKVRLEGDATIQNRLLKRPLFFCWVLMAICLAILPFTGWWLVHLIGLSLGQTWILASSVIYSLAIFSWAWLVIRLNRLRLGGTVDNSRFTLALAIVSGVCFVAIAGLLGLRPV